MFKKKSLICMFLLGLFCSLGVKAQTAGGAQIIPVNFPHSTCYFTHLSDNGLWAVASGTDEENTTISAYPYLVNATTGELIELWTGTSSSGITANDVTDDGKKVVGSYNGHPAYYDVDAKQWVTLPGNGEPTCVTPDGKRMAGYYFGGSDGGEVAQGNEIPVIWDLQADGTYEYYEVREKYNLPVRDKNNTMTNMWRITGISADGNIIVGQTNFVYVGQNGTFVFNCATGETSYPDNLLPEGVSASGSFIDAPCLSNDGSHLTGQAYCVGSGEYTSAFDMNTADNTFTLYNTFSDEQDRGGYAVTNSGMVFASSPAVNPLRYMYIRYGKLWLGLDEIISGRYGVNIYERLNQECTGYAMGVSNDEKVLLGMSMATGSGYIIRLPETFREAASHIDPLEAYTVNPASGSSFARFRNATITFTKPTTMKERATGQLLDSNGNITATVSITANADGISFNLSCFPARQLNAGEEYTLLLPAGTFHLSADDSYTNSDIRITYIGRENTPTQVEAISPQDGTSVSEISTTQPVRIQFDLNNLTVATDEDGNPAVAYLYEGDSETPLCQLSITTNNNMVGLAPAWRRYLRLDMDYRVVLPANSVTDIMGDCGNEEITINYHGAYSPEVTGEGNLFFDDFDDPSVSMATYLLYEGDHNTPAQEPQSWGFDADNNPWNFTLRDSEESTDYFAASHSMYNPAGQSDDWMSLPQLYIENADSYLNFDAQNYRANKQDRLKVYVLAAEEGYTTFTKDLYDRFKSEGKLVFDEQLNYGTSQGTVSGDWTNYEVSLADYAGKSVYIAFVNDNEDQSVVFLDSIKVYYRGAFVFNSTTASAVVDQATVPVTAQVSITGDDTYNDITATLTSGDFTSTYTATGLGLTKESPVYKIEFPDELPLVTGESNSYTITVNLDGNQVSRTSSVLNLAFQTHKRMVVEEGTGQWCGNCPLGILALDYLDNIFDGDVIGIGVHGGGPDIFSYQSYCDYLGFTSYPTGRVNRLSGLYSPMQQARDPETGRPAYVYNSEEGNGTFLDIVQSEFEANPNAEADIYVTKADMNTSSHTISIEGNVNYAVNQNSINQNIVFVILENGLEGEQENYFYSSTLMGLGDFGQGGKYGQSRPTITFNHVARRAVDDLFAGLSGLIPASVKAGDPVNFELERNAYDNVSNWGNCELVAMLINNNTGAVVNAVKVPFSVDGVYTGIDNVTAAGGEGVDVTVAGGDINVNAGGHVNVTVYDINGTLVGSASGEGTVSVPANGKGIYIVKAATGGASVVKKVAIR